MLGKLTCSENYVEFDFKVKIYLKIRATTMMDIIAFFVFILLRLRIMRELRFSRKYRFIIKLEFFIPLVSLKNLY